MAIDYNAQFTNTQQQFAASQKISDVGIFNTITDGAYTTTGGATADMFNVFSQAATATPQLMADYINNARPYISMQIVATDVFFDALDEFFNVGNNPMGQGIQVLTQDIVRPTSFANIGNNPYPVKFNNAYAQNFNYKLDLTNFTTLPATQINMYFTSPEALNGFIKGTAVSIINGHREAQWYREKMMFSVAMEMGLSPYDIGGASADLVQTILERAYDMTFMNDSFNSQGVVRATTAERIAIVIPAHTSIEIDITMLGTLFNPEVVSDHQFSKIVIDRFPDVWRYSADHIITEADVTSGYVEVATQSNNQTGLQVGGTIPAGTLAAPGATGATQTFVGETLQAWIGDKNAVMFLDDVPLTTLNYPNNLNRTINIVGHSKRSYVYANALSTLGIYSVAPTAAATSQTIVASTDIPSIEEAGVPLTAIPNTYGASETASLNVRGTTTNPAFS